MDKQNFRLVFMGTPDFAVESLKELLKNKFNVVGVVTAPDKPAGRGQKIAESAVKKYAVEQDLKVLQPTNLKDQVFQDELKTLKADLQIIVAFRMLPEAVWNMPPLGSINLHASLLPHYRGAAPINWAVINGESKTGVSTFFLKHEIDTGNLLFQKEVAITKEDTAGSIHDKLMMVGAKLLSETATRIMENDYTEIPQEQVADENTLKVAPKIFKADCKIDWTKPADEIQNKIAGLSPYPTAWAEWENNKGKIQSFKIFKTEIENTVHNEPAGTIVSDGKTYLKVAVNKGFIVLNDMQLAGKKRMPIKQLLSGLNNPNEYKIVN